MAADLDAVRRIALALPGVEEGLHHGTPAFRVRKAFIGRIREDGETFALKMDMAERDMLIEAAPNIFFLTDHYRPYPFVLIRLAAVEPERLRRLIERRWREAAPKRLVAAHDGGAPEG